MRPNLYQGTLKGQVLLYIVFCLFINIEVQGQILNIERHRLKADTSKAFLANARFAFNINNRSASEADPVNLFGVNSSLNAIYRTDNHGYILVGQTDYLRINDDTFLNFGFIHFRVNFMRERKLNYELYSQASYDNFRGLDPRVLAGGSVRLRMVNSEKTDFIAGLGGFYEIERWQHPTTEESIELALAKISTYLSVRHEIAENVDFNAVLYYQTGYDPGISAFRNRVSGNVNFNTRITKKIALNNSFEFGYEDKPVVPITRFIYALRMGVLVSL